MDDRKKSGCIHWLLKPRVLHPIEKLSSARGERAPSQPQVKMMMRRA
jgi:hypothetical protein